MVTAKMPMSPLESIKRRLVGLKMARSLEVIDQIVGRLEQGELSAVEAIDLLSIDIDGNDYWVWKAIERYVPRVVIVEYNVFFLPETAKTIAYDASHGWDLESLVQTRFAFEKLVTHFDRHLKAEKP